MSTYEDILAGKVALHYADISLNDFGRAIVVKIEEELNKLEPDTALLGLLANAARIGWELGKVENGGLPRRLECHVRHFYFF